MKKALITGSSRGIGRAIALRLARDGFHILLHGAGDSAPLRETAEEIREGGGTAEILTADLTDLDETEEFCRSIGEIDVLVLNASLQIRKNWRAITREEAGRQFNCDFLSDLLLIQSAAPYMQKQKWGRIVAIGSVQETKPHPDMLIYSACKAALSNLVRSLALQLAPDGVTVNDVAPGVVFTDRNRDALADPLYAGKVKASIPLGRFGRPEDCAGIVSLLCSDEGGYITGQTIFVDGGKSVL